MNQTLEVRVEGTVTHADPKLQHLRGVVKAIAGSEALVRWNHFPSRDIRELLADLRPVEPDGTVVVLAEHNFVGKTDRFCVDCGCTEANKGQPCDVIVTEAA